MPTTQAKSGGPSVFAAEVLRQGAAGLAALAFERMVKERPCAQGRYGPLAATQWREALASHVRHLAAAVGAGAPGVFARQVAWAKVAHAARGGDDACLDLAVAMESLRGVLIDELPPAAAGAAVPYVDGAIRTLAECPRACASELDARTAHGRLAAEYLGAVLEGERRRAVGLILDAALGANGAAPVPVPELYARVLAPAQRELGRMWQMAEAGVAEEHLATETTRTAIASLYPHLPRAERHGKTALCASVEGDPHDVGVRMVADLLEMDGWRVVCLGPSVPAEDLAGAVGMFGAELACLSASLPVHLPALGEAVARVKGAGSKALVGGAAVAAEPGLWRTLGADALGADVETAVRVAREVVGLPGLPRAAVG
jgi:methanogenic corrinoid protein MtbC1